MIQVIVIKGIGDIYLFGVPNFVKCCIYCKNSVYLTGLIYCYESNPSSHVPQMKWHSEHITIIGAWLLGWPCLLSRLSAPITENVNGESTFVARKTCPRGMVEWRADGLSPALTDKQRTQLCHHSYCSYFSSWSLCALSATWHIAMRSRSERGKRNGTNSMIESKK